jgi:SAM-dependent methyltransferase
MKKQQKRFRKMLKVQKILLLETLKIYLPLSRIQLLLRVLDRNSSSILDIGCGDGLPIIGIEKRKLHYVIGVDTDLGWIKYSKSRLIHNEYVLCDARFLPFRNNSFDIVLSLEVLFYLSKMEGLRFINLIQKMAKRQTIVSVPIGFIPPGLSEGKWAKRYSFKRGKWSKLYKSSWEPFEMEQLGYRILGINGFSFARIKNRTLHTLLFSSKINYFLSFLTGSIAYLFPNSATCMLCVKNKGNSQ